MAIYTYAGNRRKWDSTTSIRLTDVRLFLGQHHEFTADEYNKLSAYYTLLPGIVEVDLSQFPWYDPYEVDGQSIYSPDGELDPVFLPPWYWEGRPGIPSGGTTGQVLAKISDANYDTEWADGGSGGGGGSGYKYTGDYEDDGTYAYVGLGKGAAWKIYRRTIAGNIRLYASGASDYMTAWAGKDGLTYA